MASIAIKQFKGSIPRIAPHLLPANTAAKAVDCKLHHGTIESWNELEKIEDIVPEGKLHLLDCCWFDLPKCASVVQGDVSCRRIYVTGRSDYPEVGLISKEDCSIEWLRLGVPCPYIAPTIEVNEEDRAKELAKGCEARNYAYQFVNKIGERGALSPTSEVVLVNEGAKVLVSGWEIPDPSWGIESIRLYRTVSGIDAGNNQTNSFNTEFMLVAEIPITDTSFLDELENYELYEAAEEDIIMPPPEGLQGITAIGSMNTLCGFVGNRIFFTRNNQYYNWSIELVIEDNIRAIAEVNGVLYVMTDGRPYIVMAAVGCDAADCRQVIRHVETFPMIGFGNDRVAVMPTGVAYPSLNGMVMLTGNSTPFYLTSALYSPEDWQTLLPHTVISIVHDGYLFVFAELGAFVIRVPGHKTEWDADFHSSLSDRGIINAMVTRNGNMLLVKSDGVYRWNTGLTKRPHYWESPEMLTGVPINFGSCLLRSTDGNENVVIESDKRVILDRNSTKQESVFAMPLWGTGSSFKIKLTGTATVSAVSVSTSHKEHKL